MNKSIWPPAKDEAAEEDVTPLQRARMKAAAEALKSGEVNIQLACGWCQSRYVVDERERDEHGGVILNCVRCGRKTSLKTATQQRRREILAFIKAGVDVKTRPRKRAARG